MVAPLHNLNAPAMNLHDTATRFFYKGFTWNVNWHDRNRFPDTTQQDNVSIAVENLQDTGLHVLVDKGEQVGHTCEKQKHLYTVSVAKQYSTKVDIQRESVYMYMLWLTTPAINVPYT